MSNKEFDKLIKIIKNVIHTKDDNFVKQYIRATSGARSVSLLEIEKDKTLRQVIKFSSRLSRKGNDDRETLLYVVKKFAKVDITKNLPASLKINYTDKTISYLSGGFPAYNSTLFDYITVNGKEFFELYDKLKELRDKKIPESSIRKRITAKTTQSVGRFVRSLLVDVYKEEADKPSLDTVVKNIVETLQPVSLYEAITPEDFVDMYASGPSSCMSTSKTSTKTAWPELSQLGLTPTSLYGMMPDVFRGFYIKGPDGNVAARTVAFNNGGEWQIICIYSSGSQYTSKFEALLKEKGVGRLTGTRDGSEKARDNANKVTRFKIPSRTYEIDMSRYELTKGSGNYYIPTPYIDYSHEPYVLKFYELDGKTFMAINQKDFPNGAKMMRMGSSGSSHTSLVRKADAKVLTCKYCDREIDKSYTGGYIIEHPFCCAGHAISWAKNNGRVALRVNPVNVELVPVERVVNLPEWGEGENYSGIREFYASVNLAKQILGARFIVREQEDATLVNTTDYLNRNYPLNWGEIANIKSKLKVVSAMELQERHMHELA